MIKKIRRKVRRVVSNPDMWLPYFCNCGHWARHRWQCRTLEHTTGASWIACPTCYNQAHNWDRREG